MPWLVRFFRDRYQAQSPEEDLERAARIIERRFARSGLDAAGQIARAERLRDRLVDTAGQFTRMGRQLPRPRGELRAAIVTPLLDFLSDAYALTGGALFHDAIDEQLSWLLAFGGSQPHARLHGIAPGTGAATGSARTGSGVASSRTTGES